MPGDEINRSFNLRRDVADLAKNVRARLGNDLKDLACSERWYGSRDSMKNRPTFA